MRDRRTVLRGGAGLVAMGLAGCVEQDSPRGRDGLGDDAGNDSEAAADDGVGGDGNATDTGADADGNATDDGGTASFEVASAEIPESPEIGEAARYRVTVVNDGDADGRFQSPVSARAEGGEWTRVGGIDLAVQAGGEGIYRGSVAFDYIGRYELRIDALNETYSFRTSPKVLEYGETYRTPNELDVTVYDAAIRGSYPYFDEDGDRTLEYARRDRKFATVAVEVENASPFVRRAPSAEGFILVARGDQYEPEDPDPEPAPIRTERDREIGEYSGGRTYTGVTRRGVLLYDVPDSMNETVPTKVSLNEGYQGRLVSVTWQD